MKESMNVSQWFCVPILLCLTVFAVLMIGICVENTRMLEAERREKCETDSSVECVYTAPFSTKNRRLFMHFGHSFT